MTKIEFSNEEKEIIIKKMQNYFNEELDREIGRFDADFFLDFLCKELGPYFYNQGLYDAQSILREKLENINDAIYEIEKPTDLAR